MKLYLTSFTLFSYVAILFLSACEMPSQISKPIIVAPFMDMQAIDTPQLLAPKLLASSLDEYNGTFSPDGKTFFFTTNTPSQGIISYTTLGENKQWTAPKIAPFSGQYSEYDPLFSPDGKRLYFSSERPVNGERTANPTNIWYVEIDGKSWGEPQYVDLGEDGNYYSSITSKGDIYFNRWKNGDLFKARLMADSFEVVKLPEPLNSPGDEGDPFIAPDESYIIFRAYNNGLGRGDLFISFNIKGTWTTPENLGAPINSSAHEICPYVTTDGKFFIFSSDRLVENYTATPGESLDRLRTKHSSADNGTQNIYYCSASFIEKMKQQYNGQAK